MPAELALDPSFRHQFDTGVKPDPEFEAALAGAPMVTPAVRPVSQPLSNAPQWASSQMVKLG